MNDKELADAVVALGVGQKDPHQKILPYQAPDSNEWDEDELFVRDWRVAGALMEMWAEDQQHEFDIGSDKGLFYCAPQAPDDYSWNSVCWIQNESLPRAIIEACVEALGEDTRNKS